VGLSRIELKLLNFLSTCRKTYFEAFYLCITLINHNILIVSRLISNPVILLGVGGWGLGEHNIFWHTVNCKDWGEGDFVS